MEILVISGLSGSGKSKAASYLEDIGYYIVDNLPAEMMVVFAEFCAASKGRYDRVALVYDVRTSSNFSELFDVLDQLQKMKCTCHTLFLEAAPEILIQRYKESRRLHPLMSGCLLYTSQRGQGNSFRRHHGHHDRLAGGAGGLGRFFGCLLYTSMATRCCCPPESASILRCSNPFRLMISSISITRFWISSSASLTIRLGLSGSGIFFIRRPNAMFSNTFKWGKSCLLYTSGSADQPPLRRQRGPAGGLAAGREAALGRGNCPAQGIGGAVGGVRTWVYWS